MRRNKLSLIMIMMISLISIVCAETNLIKEIIAEESIDNMVNIILPDMVSKNEERIDAMLPEIFNESGDIINIMSASKNNTDVLENETLVDVIVVFKEDKDDKIIKGKKPEKIDFDKNGVRKNMLLQKEAKIKHKFEYVPIFSASIPEKNIKELRENPDVDYVELDKKIELPEIPKKKIKWGKQDIPWGISRVDAPEAWDKTKGEGIKIAILDTGINHAHPDLMNNVKGGISFIDGGYNDESGHGTHVAGIIAAEDNDFGVVGVAPEAELYAVKIMNNSGGKLSDVIKGIEWAIENDMDVISMSFGLDVLPPPLSLKEAVDRAYTSGIVLIAAAGNTGDFELDDDIYFPARYSSVIAVGAIDDSNELIGGSSDGPELELAAPGENILSTGLNKGYNSLTGTSSAAPHVTGVVALLLANNPSLRPNNVRMKLQRDAFDLGDEEKDWYYGFGLVKTNLTEANLSATIMIVFHEENKTEINPVRIEIIEIENGQENLIHTLFYDGNSGSQEIDVYPGEYLVKQYLENETLSEDYYLAEGDLIIVPLHKVNPPVHGWITYQAREIWTTSEINQYIFKDNYDDELDINGYSSDEGVLIGSGEEDTDRWEGVCIPQGEPYCWHFWEPDNCQNGAYNEGIFVYDSAYVRAQMLWDDYVIPSYQAGNKNAAYYWLGRTAHLITDMAVPAHTHLDPHPDLPGGIGGGDDAFEDFMNLTGYWSGGQPNYQHFDGSDYAGEQYNFESVPFQSGVKSNPSGLFRLFWYTAQKTQYYASDDWDAIDDDIISGNYNNYYAHENGQCVSSPTSGCYYFPGGQTDSNYLWEDEGITPIYDKDDIEDNTGFPWYDDLDEGQNLEYIAEANIPHAMKAVAGLYRLFWMSVDDDGDGVNNYYDACLTTYGTWWNGCPQPDCPTCQYPYGPAGGGAPYCANSGTSVICGAKDCDSLDGSCRDYHDVNRYCDGAGSCGSGTCNSYENAPSGWDCGVCKTCNGAGSCSSTPTDDASCGTIDCNGLDTSCRSYYDLTSNRCKSFGTCKSNNDPAYCTLYSNIAAGTECNSAFKCSNSAGGDNAYNGADYKNPSRGYCDGAGSCDQGASSPTCTYAEGNEGASYTSVCIDGSSTCQASCNDNVDNDGDGMVDCDDSGCSCTPSVNESYTSLPTPQYGDTFWVITDITDKYDYGISWCNFTIQSPNGTQVIQNQNGTYTTSEEYTGIEYCTDGTECLESNTAVRFGTSGYRWNIDVSTTSGDIKSLGFYGISVDSGTIANVTAKLCKDSDNNGICDSGNGVYDAGCNITSITYSLQWWSCNLDIPLDVTSDYYIIYFKPTNDDVYWAYNTTFTTAYYSNSENQPYGGSYYGILTKLKYSDTHWIWNSSNWTINGGTQDLGTWKWNVTCLDGQDNELFGAGNFTVSDTTNPSISIIIPEATTYNYNASLLLNISVYDNVETDTCLYWIDSGGNVTIPSCDNTVFNTSEGWHTMNVWVNDTSNNIDQDSVLFSVDLTGPASIKTNITDEQGNLINETNKAKIGKNIIFNVSVDGYLTNQFNNSLATENLTFSGDEEIIRYLEIPKSATVTSAYLTLTGYNTTSYPINPWLDIGNDDIQDWKNYTEYCNDGFDCAGYFIDAVEFVSEGGRWNINSTLPAGKIKSQAFGVFAQGPAVNPNMTLRICKDANNDLICDSGNGAYDAECNVTSITTNPAWWTCDYPVPLDVTNDAYILYSMSTGNPAMGESTAWVYINGPSSYYDGGETQPYSYVFGNNILLFKLIYENIFNGTKQTSDLSSAINSYLSTCIPATDGNCKIPFVFHSDSAGKIEYSNIQISYGLDVSSVWLVIWETTRQAGNKTGEWVMNLLNGIWTSEIQVNETFPFRTNYTIYANDSVGNVGFYDSNFSIYSPYTNLISPLNNSIDSDGTVIFNCSAMSGNNLQSITLYTNINGAWVANQTKSITGTSNSTTFTVTNVGEGIHIWSCIAYESSGDSAWANNNWTINVNFPPNITGVTLTDGQGNLINETNKAKIYEEITFNVSVSPHTENSIEQFNNSLTAENLTFGGDEEITRYLEIECAANVISAYVNLSGYNTTGYPNNSWLEIGDLDGDYEWDYTGTKEGEYTGESFDSTGGVQPIFAITQNETSFWTTDFINDKVYRYHINGTYVDSFDLNESNGNPLGIATDNIYLWVIDEIDLGVYKYSMNGTYVGFFNLANDYPWGITTNGSYLWVTSRGSTSEVFKYYMNGTYTGEYFNTASTNANPLDIAQNGTYFWTTDWSSNKIHQYYMNGTYTGNFDGPNLVFGITANNTFIWATDYSNRAYKYYTADNSYTGENFAIGKRGSISTLDITQNGTYAWALDGYYKRIHKYHMNWTYTGENFDLVSENIDPISITTNSTYIWVADWWDERVYRYYMNGSYIDYFETNISEAEYGYIYPFGITNNNTYFWLTSITLGRVYKFYMNGTYSGEYFNTTTENNKPWGITQDGDYFWITDDDAYKVFKYHMNGSYTGKNFNTTVDGQIYPIGITQNGTYFWMTLGGSIIYKFYMNDLDRTFNQTNNKTNDLASAINAYLGTAGPLPNGNCTVPFVFHSDTAGKIGYSDLRIDYVMSDIESVLLTVWKTTAESGEKLWEGFLSFISGIWTITIEVNETFPLLTNYTIYVNDAVNNTVTYKGNFSINALPITTLVSPSDNYVDTDGNVTFNCSATSYLGLSNITLYTNISGTWQANQTNNITGSLNSTSFTINNLQDNTVFKWNCLAYDGSANSDRADENWTVNVNFPPNITGVNLTDEQGNLINETNKAKIYENITFNVSVSDTDVDSVWLVAWPAESTLSLVAEIWTTSIEVDESFEPVTYYAIFANDTANNIIFYEGNFSINTSLITTLVSPSDNYVDTDGNVTFNCSATSYPGLSNITLYTNISGTWQANQTNNITGSLNSTSFTINNIPDGTFIWNCLAYDVGGQSDWGDMNWTATVDTAPPNIIEVITINESGIVEGNVVRGDNLSFNVTVTDEGSGVESVWLKIWEGAIGISNVIWQGFLSLVTGDLWSVIVGTNESFPVGEVNYTVYANDSLGNEVNVSGNFTIVLPDIHKFFIKDPSGNNVAWFGDLGNIVLKGDCTISGTCTPPANSFVIRSPSNDTVAYIDPNGNLCLESGTCDDYHANCDNPGDGSFIIRDETDKNVTFINATGNLCLIGNLIENGYP